MNTDIIETTDAQQAVVQHAPAPAGSPMAMAIAALQSGMSPEQISAMMDLQDRYNAAQAKKAYDEAFAEFKAEAVKIIKGRAVTDGPLKGKSYAELHDVVRAVTPALSRHGLSSSWALTKDERDWMEVTCFLRHVGGHQESVSMGGPPDAGGAKNAIQARASTKTYLERYTLKAITGLSEENDDTDGNVYQQTVLEGWLDRVAKAQTVKDLIGIKRDGSAITKKARDREGYRAFMEAVSERMDALQGGSNE